MIGHRLFRVGQETAQEPFASPVKKRPFSILYIPFMPRTSRLVDIFVRMGNHTNPTLANRIKAEQYMEVDYGPDFGNDRSSAQ